MNGYEFMAETWRQVLNEVSSEEQVEVQKKIRIYDFLATCDTDDLCHLVDSSAFNDLIKGYIECFLKNSSLDTEAQELALSELRNFKLKEAKSILEQKK